MRVILALSALAVAYSQATCSSYCTAYFAACSDAALNVYSGADSAAMTASCMAECAFFPATGDDAIANSSNTGNTLGCREYHAVAAAAGTTEAATHCPHARPDSTFCKSQAAADLGLGSGTCDNFCDNLKMTCGSTLLGANRDACMRSCARYRDQPTPSGMFPLAAATGDLSCRRYHVQVARTDAASATTHCPHADLLGGNGVCGAGAFNFCQQATGACMNNQTGYTDAAGCAAIWPNIPAGAAADMSGDTQFCRAYHLSVALQSAATATTHCPHTGQAGAAAGTTGAATCGDACDAYCSQYASVCANITAAAKYADTAACRTACTAFAATGMTGSTTSANTLQCRLYHLGVAATGGAATATHCPHAAQNGGGAGGPCAGGAAPTPAGGSSASSTAVSALALAVPVLAFLRV